MSYFLGIVSAIHLWTMSIKWKYSGYFGIILQLIWTYYVIDIKQYGLLISGVLFFVIHVKTAWDWHLKKSLKQC